LGVIVSGSVPGNVSAIESIYLKAAEAGLHVAGGWVGRDVVPEEVSEIDRVCRVVVVEDEKSAFGAADGAGGDGFDDGLGVEVEVVVERVVLDDVVVVEESVPGVLVDGSGEASVFGRHADAVGKGLREFGFELTGDTAVWDGFDVGGAVGTLFGEPGGESPGAGDTDFERVGCEGGEVDGVFVGTVVEWEVAVTGASRAGPGGGVLMAVRSVFVRAGVVATVVAVAGAVSVVEGVGEFGVRREGEGFEVVVVGDVDGCGVRWLVGGLSCGVVADDLHASGLGMVSFSGTAWVWG
jgi:hypothetical protein